MAYYPTPTVNDTKSLLAVTKFINTDGVTGGLFMPVMLLVIWFIMFFGLMGNRRGGSRAWIYASFVSTILAILLGMIALISQKYVYLAIIAFSLGVFWFKLVNSRD